MGMVCANGASYTIVAFQPVDSVKYAHSMATGNMAGYGWRDANGNLSYVESGVSLAGGGSDATTCTATGATAANLSTAFVGTTMVRRVAPIIATAYTGMPVFLHSRVTYAFGPSTSVPGRRGLYRTIGSSAPEELVAPFDTAAKFRFFWADSASAKDAPPAALDDLAGIELFMVGVNERTANPDAAETTPVRTAVFFKN